MLVSSSSSSHFARMLYRNKAREQLAVGNLARSMTDATKPAETSDKARAQTAAERALKEAQERRSKRGADASPVPEVGGRTGPDPTRYGDWEKGGIASDF
jgi:hypothetical protein